MTAKTRKILNIISGTAVALVVIAAVMLIGVRLVGLRPFVVLSGSMEPEYHVGSLIYVKDTAPEDIEVGDPITFVLNKDLTVATHRVVEIDDQAQHFITKGDANEFKDANPVHFNNLIGKPVMTIPKIGYFVNYIQNPPGKYLAIAFAALCILLAFLPDLFDDSDKKKKKKAKDKSPDTEG